MRLLRFLPARAIDDVTLPSPPLSARPLRRERPRRSLHLTLVSRPERRGHGEHDTVLQAVPLRRSLAPRGADRGAHARPRALQARHRLVRPAVAAKHGKLEKPGRHPGRVRQYLLETRDPRGVPALSQARGSLRQVHRALPRRLVRANDLAEAPADKAGLRRALRVE